MDRVVLDRLSTLVAQASGIHVRPEGRWLLTARIEARMRAVGDTDPRAYASRVESSDAELGALVEAIRVGETRFFRHGAQLSVLRRVVLPEIRARAAAGDRKVRAWSAGCSTGEEPYTLAMLLDDAMPRERGFDVEVLATDISEDALAKASRGHYEAEAIGPVPEDLRARYFVASGGEWAVSPALRAIVRFEPRNLRDRVYPRGFDVVLCRNVLIYFGPDGRDAVIKRLAGSLVPGGFLFLGYAETLREFEGEFEVITTDEGTLYRRPNEKREDEDEHVHVHEHVDVHVDEVAAVSVLVAKGSYEGDERRFVRELGPLLEGGAPVVYVDLDGADLLSDGVARDLRRARAALEHEGRKLVVVAQRAGVLRWLERVGLAGEIAVVRKGEVPR